MKYARFEEVAQEAFDSIPPEYKEGIDGLVVSRKVERHPTLPEIYTLGHCDTEAYLSDWQSPETTRSKVVLYWGSFLELSRLDPDFDWEAEIYETVEHEVRHHLEWLAGEDQLEDVDYAMDESFKRGEGLDWDPWYYQRGEHAGAGVYIAEDQVYLEVEMTAQAFEAADTVPFRWQGRTWEIDRPDELGDVHYVLITDGVDRLPAWMEVVLVRSRSWWEDVGRMFGSSRLRVLESEAVARGRRSP